MEKNPYRSIFWPVILIGVGAIWLLSNLGFIDGNALSVLWSLWPVLLVLAGVDLLFGRQWPWLSALIALLALGGVILLLVAGPALGITAPQVAAGELKTEQFSAPLDGATSARLELDISSYGADLRAGRTADQLVNATITHRGRPIFDVSGGAEKLVRIGEQEGVSVGFFSLRGGERWQVTLTDGLPWEVSFDGGSGSFEADLTNLDLRGLRGDIGSGSVTLRLPETASPYRVELEGGSGSLRADLPGQTDLEVRLDGGSGSLNLTVPSGTAMRLEVLDGGSGSINAPREMSKIEGDRSEDEGVWETEGFSGAEKQLVIVIEDLGSGSFSLRSGG